MALVCLQSKWACYTFDFQDRVVTVVDPNLVVMSSKDFAAHQKNANLLLLECVRCMRKLGGNGMAGTGEWRGKMLVPRHRQFCDRGMWVEIVYFA